MKEAAVIKFEILVCSWMEGLIANTKIGNYFHFCTVQ